MNLLAPGNGRVVDEDVDTPPAIDHLLHGGRHALLVAHIHLEGLGLEAVLTQRVGCRLPVFGADLEDSDTRAFLDEAPARGLANAGATAGDDGDLVVQTTHHGLPSWCCLSCGYPSA